MAAIPDGRLRILQPEVTLADPHTWSDDRSRLNVRFAVFEALVRPAPGGTFDPGLAERWQVDEDARTWTLWLRPEVRTHDGGRLTVADVVASLDRARSPGVPGELGTAGLFNAYLGDASVSALDGVRLCIVTARPMADLLDLLVEIPVLPETALSDPQQLPIGTGPYRVAEIGPGKLEAEVFENYWAGRPSQRHVTWQAEPSEEARLHALLDGQADVATELSVGTAAAAREKEGLHGIAWQSKLCVIFLCNAAKGPCVDRRVRQALNLALDKRSIIRDVRLGAAEELNGPLSPLHFGYDPDTPPYGYDPGQARALLQAAGYGSGLELTLDVPSRLPDEAIQLAEIMAHQYGDAGVTIRMQVYTDRLAYAEMVKAKHIHDAACFDSSPLSTYRVLREKFHSGVAGTWWQGYRNIEVDRLLDTAGEMVDPTRRRALYRQAYRIIRDDAPWIFLYRPTVFWGLSSRIQLLKLRADGVLSF